MTPEQAKAFRRKLLAWYRKNRRDLPWRPRPRNGNGNGRGNGNGNGKSQLPDPYHTLVSEAMLQQTQVATVVPYFRRFIEAFPTAQALADAHEQQVLTLWQGLGYYRRARNLHAAAKMIVTDLDGQVPATVNDLLKLPGVGRYTAGAIASIAHGTQAAVVDGNVERVFARLFLIEEPINAPATKKHVWSIAEQLVPKSRPGDYNQALMELGATRCTPKLPKCFVCPVREHCRGVQETDPQRLPAKLAKNKPKAVTHVVVAVERNGKYLFEQRPSDGLWSNMWQLPTWEQPTVSRRLQGDGSNVDKPDHTTSVAFQPTANPHIQQWFTQRFGLAIDPTTQSADFTHQTTHRTIRFVVLHATVKSGRLKPKTGIWRKLDQIDDLPMSNPQRKAINSVAA